MNSLLVALEYINDNHVTNRHSFSDEMAIRYYEYHVSLYKRFKEYGNSNKLTIYDNEKLNDMSNNC